MKRLAVYLVVACAVICAEEVQAVPIEFVFKGIGKRNTQKLERKHLGLRTRIKRLARKTICFSKSIQMYDIVIGLFINRSEFMVTI